jgi:hypothetical protein
MAELKNPRHEQFCHYVAAGLPRYKAFALACSQSTNTKGHWEGASKLWARSEKVRKRVSELQKQRRKAQELTYDALLDDVLLNCDLARESGQHAPALTGLKLLGQELFHAFTERKEILNLEVKARSKAELRELLVQEYGEEATEVLWSAWTKPKMIQGTVTELQPDTEPQDHDHDIDVRGDVVPAHGAVIGAQDSESNGVNRSDTARARGPIDDMTRHAMQSLDRSKPPKV